MRRARLHPQQVEVLRRGRRSATRRLPSATSCRNRSMRALECSGPAPSYPCGSKQREAGGLTPLRLPRSDELIDDDLRAVDEVAELRFPEHERFRFCDAVSVLESDARVFGERAVVDFERRLRARRKCWSGIQTSRRRRIVKDGVAVAERSALGILTGEPNRRAFGEQRRERERLGRPPVDDHLSRQTRLRRRSNWRASFAINREARRNGAELVAPRHETARGRPAAGRFRRRCCCRRACGR